MEEKRGRFQFVVEIPHKAIDLILISLKIEDFFNEIPQSSERYSVQMQAVMNAKKRVMLGQINLSMKINNTTGTYHFFIKGCVTDVLQPRRNICFGPTYCINDT